ncbi:hypothetical protein LXA43DRAFT_513618 [Ganoderma leucocontextum]|nr:hypothetical protein LXA43DRAFT_513618 [Ganoderma leucocontextum]
MSWPSPFPLSDTIQSPCSTSLHRAVPCTSHLRCTFTTCMGQTSRYVPWSHHSDSISSNFTGFRGSSTSVVPTYDGETRLPRLTCNIQRLGGRRGVHHRRHITAVLAIHSRDNLTSPRTDRFFTHLFDSEIFDFDSHSHPRPPSRHRHLDLVPLPISCPSTLMAESTRHAHDLIYAATVARFRTSILSSSSSHQTPPYPA